MNCKRMLEEISQKEMDIMNGLYDNVCSDDNFENTESSFGNVNWNEMSEEDFPF